MVADAAHCFAKPLLNQQKHTMQAQSVLKALVKKSEQIDFDQPDANARILVAASLEIIKTLAAQMDCPKFDMDNELDKVFLLGAVSETDPDADLTEEDKLIIQRLNEVRANQAI